MPKEEFTHKAAALEQTGRVHKHDRKLSAQQSGGKEEQNILLKTNSTEQLYSVDTQVMNEWFAHTINILSKAKLA